MYKIKTEPIESKLERVVILFEHQYYNQSFQPKKINWLTAVNHIKYRIEKHLNLTNAYSDYMWSIVIDDGVSAKKDTPSERINFEKMLPIFDTLINPHVRLKGTYKFYAESDTNYSTITVSNDELNIYLEDTDHPDDHVIINVSLLNSLNAMNLDSQIN